MGFLSLIAYVLVGAILLQITSIVYNIYFHPLAKFKGPLLWRASRLPFVLAMVSGQLPHRVRRLHEQYGEVVRVAPNELTFIDPAAWKDIYQNSEFIRPWIWRGKPPGAEGDNLISATEPDHARFRKVLGPCFSEQSVRRQEPIVQGYVDLLIEKIGKAISESTSDSVALDMVEWLNYTTFDVIGDLGWGSPFGCLQSQKLTGWIQVVLHFKAVVIAVAVKYFPPLDTILEAITPKSALADILGVVDTAREKVAERLAVKTDRPDVIGHVVTQTADSSSSLYMTKAEMDLNSVALIVAGSESLTTILSGTINNLLATPNAMHKLVKEIRSSFKSQDEITGVSLSKLEYLHAVFQEGMRSTPSNPDGSRRDISKSGATIAGHFIPGGTTVSVPQWPAYTSPLNFVNPTSFAPERWLSSDKSSSSKYSRDRKAIFQPFAVGSHNCLGQPLAWLEMRLILARLLWNYDLALPDMAKPLDWSSQEIYWTWVKKPMVVKISRR